LHRLSPSRSYKGKAIRLAAAFLDVTVAPTYTF
jgi:hypothetical protein